MQHSELGCDGEAWALGRPDALLEVLLAGGFVG